MSRHIAVVVVCLSIVSAVAAQPTDRNRFGSGRNEPSDEYRPTRGPRGPEGPGGPAGPGGPGAPMEAPAVPMFDAIDADGDGSITMRELRKAVVALRKLDVDEDGNLTREEALGPLFSGPAIVHSDPNAAVDRFMQGDRDGDGKLSPNELPPGMAQMFQGADRNGDGALDRAELAAAMQSAQARFGRGPGPFGGPAGNPVPGHDLMRYDQNGDGQLSPDEVPANVRGMLRGSDQNHDGVLDSNEVGVINQRMNERMRGGPRLPPGVEIGPDGLQRTQRGQ